MSYVTMRTEVVALLASDVIRRIETKRRELRESQTHSKDQLFADVYCGNQYAIARALLNACTFAETINVSVTDLEAIS